MLKTVIVLVIFVATYLGVVWEKMHRTTTVVVGATLMLAIGIVTPAEAWGEQDYNTLGLLVGMMIIVGVIKKTGLLQYVAIKVTKISRGSFLVLFILFSSVTAVVSAFLDNVTTILLVAPITILIAESAGKNALPFLISEVICSNIGGTATLIGDPPNMLIGSAAGYSFIAFLINLSPIVILILLLSVAALAAIYRTHLKSVPGIKMLESVDERRAIQDPKLLRSSMIIFGLILAGFILHGAMNILPSVVALAGAILLLAVTRINPDEALAEVEWSTLFFFVGLFVVVGALDKVGVISAAARGIVSSVQNPSLLRILILWISGIASAFLGAVPVAAAFIPLIETLGKDLGLSAGGLAPIWWSLALGASLGGIGTVLGTAATMVAVGISARTRYKISYRAYLRVGSTIMVLSLAVSTIYLLLRY
jgi:Na+/H+ antiporter NhaD/arsenite permease-like protein